MNSSYSREQAKSQHRVISLFCAIQCWLQGWDGIRISRAQFEQLLDLQRFRTTRTDWIKEDFEDLFPYQREYSMLFSLELSRRPFEEKPVLGELYMPEHSVVPCVSDAGRLLFPPFVDTSNYSECSLLACLWLLANGRVSPRDIGLTDCPSLNATAR